MNKDDSVWIKRSYEVCKKCKYSRKFIGRSIMCDYANIKKHSRTFDENGKQKQKALEGYCDCFEKRDPEEIRRLKKPY